MHELELFNVVRALPGLDPRDVIVRDTENPDNILLVRRAPMTPAELDGAERAGFVHRSDIMPASSSGAAALSFALASRRRRTTARPETVLRLIR